MNELQIESEKNRLRKKVTKIYDAFKKFHTTIERGDVKFNFTVILPPVPTIGFTEVAQMNNFGFVYDDDSGEVVIEKVEPRIIIPRFYIVYDEKFIDNLEWAKKPDFNWLQAKIKDIVIKKFKHFKINITHIQNHTWVPIDSIDLNNTSSLWNSNLSNKILSEETSETFEVEKQRLLKKLKSILQIYRKGTVTLRCESSDEDLFFDYEILGEPHNIKFLGKYGKPDELGNRPLNGLKLETQFDEVVIYPKQQNDYLTLMKCDKSAYSVWSVLKSRFKKFDIIVDFWEGRFIKSENLNESWTDQGYKDRQYVKDLEQNPISDEDYNRLLKKAKALYFTFKEGDFTTQFKHPVSGENWAKGKTHYVLPDEPRSFIPEFRRFGGDWWDSEDEGRSLKPRISVADSEIKLYIVPTDNINVNERLHRIYTQYLIKNGDYYTLPPEEPHLNGVNRIVDELRKNMHSTISKKFHQFNSHIGFYVR